MVSSMLIALSRSPRSCRPPRIRNGVPDSSDNCSEGPRQDFSKSRLSQFTTQQSILCQFPDITVNPIIAPYPVRMQSSLRSLSYVEEIGKEVDPFSQSGGLRRGAGEGEDEVGSS